MSIVSSIRGTKARIDAHSARVITKEKLERTRKGTLLARVTGAELYHDRVEILGSARPVAPAQTIMLTPSTTAYVDTAGAIQSRVTATRLVATGPFALAMPKKSDGRDLYLYVEDPAGVAMLKLPPEQSVSARQLAVALTNAVIGLDAAKAKHAAEMSDLEAQLAALDA